MTLPDEIVRKEIYAGWQVFIDNLEKSLDMLEKEIDFTSKMVDACTLEWCQATEHAIPRSKGGNRRTSDAGPSGVRTIRELQAMSQETRFRERRAPPYRLSRLGLRRVGAGRRFPHRRRACCRRARF